MTTNLHDLLIALIRAKPQGWSVVRRMNEIQIRPRPAERRLAKFIVRRNVTTAVTLTVGCCDLRRNSWENWAECPPDPAAIFTHLTKHLEKLRQAET